MSPQGDRWTRVEALYHGMLALAPGERGKALAAACGGDADLEGEILSLLDQPDSAAGFMARPAMAEASHLVSQTRSLLTGRRIGAFEVKDLLGIGGMGEVYRARDTKLGRDVAIKVLPEALAQDGERLARFNREAQALAALNHPNVAVIHGVEELPAASGEGPRSRALVMELVDGEDLSAHIARGPMPMAQALPIARQIARALEAAHERGIVHRDLKPANIKIRRDGTVKVLDFGLAKMQPVLSADAGLRDVDTQPGTVAVMGTPGYMSPEQIRGQKVDWRSDLFAFGVVLYEMLSGRRAFAKASGAETMSATLTETLPDLNAIAPGTDPAICVAVARCLQKEPEKRFQSASDLGLALETLNLSSGRGASAMLPRPKASLPVAAALALTLITVLALAPRKQPASLPSTSRQVTSDGQSLTGDLSPDGETLAYISGDFQNRRLMVRDLAGGAPVERYRGERIFNVRWSHSGREIAVTAADDVLVFPRFGGEPVRIAGHAFRISWSPDDSELILGSHRDRSFGVASVQTRVVRRIEMDARIPGGTVTDLSPDGERLLFFVWRQPHDGLWSMKKDGTDIRQHVRERRRTYDARFAEDGASFYYLVVGDSVSEIRRARILPEGPDPSPAIVQSNLTIQESSNASIAISRDGTLAYPRVSFDRNIWRADLSPSLSSEDPIPLRPVTKGTRYGFPRFSPDGAQMVFTRRDGELSELLIASAEGDIRRVLVSRNGAMQEPAWSPDGESVAYSLDDESGRTLHVASVRSGADRAFVPVNAPADPEWAPGSRLIYIDPRQWVRTLDPTNGENAPLLDSEDGASHYSPRYSNRGDRIAMFYDSGAKKGVAGLAVVSLPDRSSRILPETWSFIVRPIGWSADDAFIYAVDESSNKLLAVRSDGAGRRTIGTLPSRKSYGHAVEMGGMLKLVLYYPNDRSDLWVVDNFDGGRR